MIRDLRESMSHQETRFVKGYVLVGTGLLVFALLAFMNANREPGYILREGGLVESASVAGYLLCLCLMLYRGGVKK